MTGNGWLQIALFLGLLAAATPFQGTFMARIYAGERTFLTPLLGPVERRFYQLAGVDPGEEMTWRRYTAAFLGFNLAGFVALFLLLLGQGLLPGRLLLSRS
jgi:potassium-transporting ATPase potassium-binding subunit